MKNFTKIFFILILLLFAAIPTTGETPPQPVIAFSACQKEFIKQSEPFFYVVLSSLAKNNYKIEEIQSKNGLIIFKVYNKDKFIEEIELSVAGKHNISNALACFAVCDYYKIEPSIVKKALKEIM